jgi:rhamnogalacturonyl hydrolase YesR
MNCRKIFGNALILGALIFGSTISALAQSVDYFANLPAGTTPQEVGKRLADHFVASPHMNGAHPASVPAYMHTIGYAEVGTWYGALNFAQLTKNEALQKQLIARFDPLMPGGAEDALRPRRHHVDDSIFGTVPLEVAIETKDQKYLAEGKSWADRQWGPLAPDTPPELPQDVHDALVKDGLSPETRFWVDDMYMLTILQLQAYRATGDSKYLDRDAKEMVAYLDKLQQPNGLFFHAPDVPFYWGRGNGWFAAGMAEMLRSLPKDHPQRARIEDGYRKMMAGLLKYQGKDGTWRQLIDHEEAWPESSGSAMFTFAMITGVKLGILDGYTYGPAARKAWLGVIGYIDQNGDVTNVCEGTNKLNDLNHYLTRHRRTGDFHGQAPILWAADALLR